MSRTTYTAEFKAKVVLKTIGQLTLERDYLQECFRICGRPIPEYHKD